MAKRSRDETGVLHQLRQDFAAKPPPTKRYKEKAGKGVGTTGEIRGRAIPEAEEKVVVSSAAAPEEEEQAAPAGALPAGWWRVWWRLAGGGGDGGAAEAVDYEELLRGWFPFVEEDFCWAAGERAGLWWLEEDADVDDIWQLKHVNEIPSQTR